MFDVNAKPRMPFVRFVEREYGNNPEASLAAGRPIPRLAIMAVVNSHGSKDEFEAPAEEWIKQKRLEASRGNYDGEWVKHFEKQLAEYKAGNELPREGTPIATWQAATSEQRLRLKAFGITVVEDLAQVPDGAVSSLGLDGRYIRDLARNWINEAKDKGVNSKALADANVKIEQQQASIDALQAQVNSLLDKLTEPKKKSAA